MLLLCCCSCCCPSSETDEKKVEKEGSVTRAVGKAKEFATTTNDDDEAGSGGGARVRQTRVEVPRRHSPSHPKQSPSDSLSLSRKREKKKEDRVRAQDSVLRCAALPCVRHDHAHGRRRPRRRRAPLGPRCLRCGALTINQLAWIACVRLGGEAFLLSLFFSLPNLCRNPVLRFRKNFAWRRRGRPLEACKIFQKFPRPLPARRESSRRVESRARAGNATVAVEAGERWDRAGGGGNCPACASARLRGGCLPAGRRRGRRRPAQNRRGGTRAGFLHLSPFSRGESRGVRAAAVAAGG